MKNTVTPDTVDTYIRRFPPATRTRLQALRKTIRKAAPAAEELISYKMPAYKFNGMLVYFAGYDHHIGFYAAPTGHTRFKKELSAYKSGKGSVQFPHDQELPLGLIDRIVRFRMEENGKDIVKKKKSAKPVKNKDTKKENDAVSKWLSDLPEEKRKEIDAVRKLLKAASPDIRERIKWNAPSYYTSSDLFTFGPLRKSGILLVFHHPAIVTIKSGLLEGNYKDRRLIRFSDSREAQKNQKELSRIVRELVKRAVS